MIKNSIGFTEHNVGEEALYSFLLVYHATSISFLKGPVYSYINRPGSQSDRLDDDPLGDVAHSMGKIIEEMGLCEQFGNTLNAFVATAAIVSLDRMARYYGWQDYKVKARERIISFHTSVRPDYKIDKAHMDLRAQLLYPFLRRGYILPIYIASKMHQMIVYRK